MLSLDQTDQKVLPKSSAHNSPGKKCGCFSVAFISYYIGYVFFFGVVLLTCVAQGVRRPCGWRPMGGRGIWEIGQKVRLEVMRRALLRKRQKKNKKKTKADVDNYNGTSP